MFFLIRWAFRLFVFATLILIFLIWTNRGNVLSYVRSAEAVLQPFFYQDAVRKYAQQYGQQDPLLITAVIKAESKFYKKAKSHRGATGLMQLMPSTAKEIAKELKIKKFRTKDLENPQLNIQLGCYYLSKLQNEFDHDIPATLAAYNAGPKNVKIWLRKSHSKELQLKDIEFPETQQYVQEVLRTWRWLKNLNQVRQMLLNALSYVDKIPQKN